MVTNLSKRLGRRNDRTWQAIRKSEQPYMVKLTWWQNFQAASRIGHSFDLTIERDSHGNPLIVADNKSIPIVFIGVGLIVFFFLRCNLRAYIYLWPWTLFHLSALLFGIVLWFQHKLIVFDMRSEEVVLVNIGPIKKDTLSSNQIL